MKNLQFHRQFTFDKKTFSVVLFFTFIFAFASLSKEQIYEVRKFKQDLLSKKDANTAKENNKKQKSDLLFPSLNANMKFPKKDSVTTILQNPELNFAENVENSIEGKITNPENNFSNDETSFDAFEKQGQIGVLSEKDEDKISDNIFSINIPKQTHTVSAAYLEYELYGLANHQSVSRSINQNPSIGGQVIVLNNNWTKQKESINLNLLQEGNNKILFTVPTNGIIYKVKNVKVVFAHESQSSTLENISSIYNGNSIYLKGFVKNTKSGYSQILIDGVSVNTFNGEFEKTILLNAATIAKGFVSISVSGNIINYPITKKQIDAKNIKEELLRPQIFQIEKGKEYKLNYEGANIEVDKEDVSESDLMLGVLKLRGKDFPTTNQGIKNVTLNGRAYRFKAETGKISKKVKISIPYDTKLLGTFSAKEIKVFYFDYNTKKWMVETSSKLDETTKTIAFNATGEGDYINGIISVPESPQLNAFAPTSISGLKAADPTSSLQFMSPPSANQKGDLNTSYAIKVPSGINGMQPSLSIGYNSGAGNGWMGEGWDVNGLSAISIDTRWGTPEFDPGIETELYSLDGEMLIYPDEYLPHRHTGDNNNLSTARQLRSAKTNVNTKLFYLRKNHNFSIIERIGTSPSNYVWKVTGTNGVKNYYGGDAGGSSTLKNDASGQIVQWGLWKTEDTHGNIIEYTYHNNIISNNTNLNDGKWFHIKKISYGKNKDYTVHFIPEANIVRNDISINAKQGVKRVEPYRLKTVSVNYQSDTIRSYNMEYDEGEFSKTRLKRLYIKHTRKLPIVEDYVFDYYDDLNNQGQSTVKNFGIDEFINVNNKPDTFNGITQGIINPSKINANRTSENGLMFRPAVGINLFYPSQDPYAHVMFGFPFGFSNSEAKNAQQLTDFNGDGIQDMIYRNPNFGLFFSEGSFLNGTLQFAEPKPIINYNSNFSFTKTKSNSWGWDMGVTLYSKSTMSSSSNITTSTYLTDANSDGLMDIVNNGTVWFNRYNQGQIEMTQFSEYTENMVVKSKPIQTPANPKPLIYVDPAPTIDVVKVWIAPKDGFIRFSDEISVKDTPIPSTSGKAIYSVEIKNPVPTPLSPPYGLLKNARIFLTELNLNSSPFNFSISRYNDHFAQIQGMQSNPYNNFGINNSDRIYVKSGDKIYIRLHKNNDVNFQIISNPKITYLDENTWTETANTSELEQGNFHINNGSYSDNFLLNNGFQPILLDSNNGNATIKVASVNFPKTTDGFTMKIVQELTGSPGSTPLPPLAEFYYPQSDTPFTTIDIGYTTPPITVNSIPNTPTVIKVLIESDSFAGFLNENWNKAIPVEYNATNNLGNAVNITYNVVPQYPSFAISQFSKKVDILNPPITSNFSAGNNNYGIQINKNVSNISNLGGGSFVYIVKKGNKVIVKRKITVDAGSATILEADFTAYNTPPQTINGYSPAIFYQGDITQSSVEDRQINIQVYCKTSADYHLFKYYTENVPDKKPFIIYENNNVLGWVKHTSVNTEMYNGKTFISNNWGQFLYNNLNNISNPSSPIDSFGRLIDSDTYFAENTSSLQTYPQCLGITPQTALEQCISNANLNSSGTPPIEPIAPLKIFNKITPSDHIQKWIGVGIKQYAMADSFRNDNTVNYFNDPNPDPQAQPPVTLNSPQISLDTTMKGIDRKEFSKSENKTVGGNLIIVNVGNSETKLIGLDGSIEVQDFRDMNGDGYPDMVYADALQPSNSLGSLNDIGYNFAYGNLTNSESYYKQNSIGKSYNAFSASGRGSVFGSSSTTTKADDSSTWSGNASIGAQLNVYYDSTDYGKKFWRDINGDGLPDLIEGDGTANTTVKFNLGKSLSGVYPYQNLIAYKSHPIGSIQSNIGGGLSQFVDMEGLTSFGFGINASVGATSSLGSADAVYEDINGDGMLDILEIDGNNSTTVRYNLGNKFDDPKPLMKSSTFVNFANETTSYNSSLSFGGHLFINIGPIPILPILPVLWIYLKAGAGATANFGVNISDVNKTFKDMNGDGFVDLVVNTSNGFSVNYSKIGRTNKLKSIRNAISQGTYTVDYQFTTPTYEDPHAKLIVKEVRVLNPDAFSSSYTTATTPTKDFVTTYKFGKSKYDRRERENFGFDTMTIEEPDGSNNVYRSTVNTYHNSSYMLAGLLANSQSFKGTTILKSETKNTYKIFKFTSNNSQIDLPFGPLPINFDTGGKEGRKMATVLLDQTATTSYETGGQIQTKESMTYHPNGLLKNHLYSSPSTTYNTEISYHTLGGNIINIPMGINVYAGTTNSNLLRQRSALNPDPITGDIGKYAIFDGYNNVETDFQYDSYGNIIKVEYPPNESTQIRFTLDYIYDTLTSKYAIEVKDNYDVHSTAEYNQLFDVITQATDVAGNIINYHYDGRGRLLEILGPNEQAASLPFTVRYNYEVGNFGLPNSNPVVNLYKVTTLNMDTAHPTNPIKIESYADFTGKVIQTKKDIEIGGTEKRSVSGRTIYDRYNRPIMQHHPREEANNISNLNITLSQYKTTTDYDEFDRVLKFKDEAGVSKNNVYNISASNYTTVETIQNQKTKSFANAEGKIVTRENYLNGQALVTQFQYNTVGELLSVTDPEGLSTQYAYDLAGRRVEQIHPDKGTTMSEYDVAGNLMRIKTENLANDPNISVPYINYQYDYANRLIGIQLPDLPNGNTNPNNVIYEYAGNGSGNQTGRLVYKADGTGYSTYDYGNLGELIHENRVVQGYNINIMTFNTSFEYDSWNRIKNILYPDGEKLHYTYDLGGNLKSVANDAYDYIKDILYDVYEQKTRIINGNDTSSEFSYKPNTRMLYSHILKDSSSSNLLNNQYHYDDFGNITNLLNTSDVSQNEMGGNYLFKYQYDNLNRLESATGFFRFADSVTDPKEDPLDAIPVNPLWSPYVVSNSTFDISLSYNNAGGIVFKGQHHEQDLNINVENTYENHYQYIDGTHKLEVVEDASAGNTEFFEYDHNGNAVLHITPNNEEFMYWDEQDRMKAFYNWNSGVFQYNTYDDGGERTIKYILEQGAQLFQNGEVIDQSFDMKDYTIYPNPYVVVTSDGRYTKHYFTGSTRFASRIEDGNDIFQQRPSGQQKESARKSIDPSLDLKTYLKKAGLDDTKISTEFARAPAATSGLYFLHGDHLGTASYVTDANGETTQFFLNLPFGETMAEQNLPGAYENQYKFNAKELDRETNLYYYGARYYNPRLSIWYGVDPLAEKMPSWSPYVYTFNNPVNFVDPDGREPYPPMLILSYRGSIGGWNVSSRRSQSTSFNLAYGLSKYTQMTYPVSGVQVNIGFDSFYFKDRTTAWAYISAINNLDAINNNKAHHATFNSSSKIGSKTYNTSQRPQNYDDGSINGQALSELGCNCGAVMMGTMSSFIAGPGRVSLRNAQQVSGRFQLEGGPSNGTLYRANNNGEVTSYITYDYKGLAIKRVDVTGASHNGVSTPHVIDYGRTTLPDGTVRVQSKGLGNPRAARTNEIPKK